MLSKCNARNNLSVRQQNDDHLVDWSPWPENGDSPLILLPFEIVTEFLVCRSLKQRDARNIAKEEPGKQRAYGSERDCALWEICRLEGRSRERPNTCPDADFTDIIGMSADTPQTASDELFIV